MAKKARKAAKKSRKALRPVAKQQATTLSHEAPSRDTLHKTKIRVIGIGGGGGSIVTEIARNVEKADFVAANTDLQAQKNLSRLVKGFAFGEAFTQGLGCGMDAQLGEQAARAEKDRIKKLMEGQDVCIFVVSLGGGTGTGAAPVFAEAAKEAKCLSLGIFTLPFSFEGEKRSQIAKAGLESIIPLLNAYVLLPNENIFRVIDGKTPLKEAFSAVNKRLAETLEGFIETISIPGLVNIDFADIRTLLEGRGKLAYLNTVQAQGPAKGQLAIKEVLQNPLFDYTIQGVDRMVFNVTGDKGMKMQEVADISRAIAEHNLKARIIFGVSFDSAFKDKIRIALFAVGAKQNDEVPRKESAVKKAPKQQPAAKPKAAKKKAKAPAAPVAKKPVEAEPVSLAPPVEKKEVVRVRKTALDLKKAQDEEMKELEKKERQWDIPAFLRNARHQENPS